MRIHAGRLLRAGHRQIRRRGLDAAVAAFAKAVESARDDRRPYIQLALAQARRGDCQAACLTVETMLKRFPGDVVVEICAGRCLLECDHPADAEPLLRSAVQSAPENALAQQYLALCQLMKGDLAAASAGIERMGLAANADFLALFSYEVERRLAPTSLLDDKEVPPPSESHRTVIAGREAQAACAPPSSLFARLSRRRAMRKLARLGEQAYDGDDFAAALAAFEAAHRCGLEERIVWLGAGLSNLRLDRPNQAIHYLAQAFARWPNDGIVASSYADALYRAGRIAEALAVFEKIEPAGPEDFHAHYGRGACYAALGQKPVALEQFRNAFQQYRLDTLDDCLAPSWQELLKKEQMKECEAPTRD